MQNSILSRGIKYLAQQSCMNCWCCELSRARMVPHAALHVLQCLARPCMMPVHCGCTKYSCEQINIRAKAGTCGEACLSSRHAWKESQQQPAYTACTYKVVAGCGRELISCILFFWAEATILITNCPFIGAWGAYLFPLRIPMGCMAQTPPRDPLTSMFS